MYVMCTGGGREGETKGIVRFPYSEIRVEVCLVAHCLGWGKEQKPFPTMAMYARQDRSVLVQQNEEGRFSTVVDAHTIRPIDVRLNQSPVVLKVKAWKSLHRVEEA